MSYIPFTFRLHFDFLFLELWCYFFFFYMVIEFSGVKIAERAYSHKIDVAVIKILIKWPGQPVLTARSSFHGLHIEWIISCNHRGNFPLYLTHFVCTVFAQLNPISLALSAS